MKRIIHISAALLTLIIMVQALALPVASADSGISLSGPESIAPDDTFEITVSVSGNDIYGVSGAVTFSGAVTLKSSDADLEGDWKTEINTVENTVYFAAADQKQNTPINKKTDVLTLTFAAGKNTGESLNISVGEAVASDVDTQITLGSASYSKTVTNASDSVNNMSNVNNYSGGDALSNNNLLNSLIVKNAEISPVFDPEVKNYEATVPFTTEELEVEATAADDKATVNIGDTKLEYVGNNIVRVEVLSESGLKRTYKIYTTRQDRIKTQTEPGDSFPVIWIVIICVGAALVLAAAVFCTVYFLKKRRNRSN